MQLNGKKIADYEIEVSSFRDFDDYEAYFVFAKFEDGSEATEKDLEQLDQDYAELVCEKAYENAVSSADFMGD